MVLGVSFSLLFFIGVVLVSSTMCHCGPAKHIYKHIGSINREHFFTTESKAFNVAFFLYNGVRSAASYQEPFFQVLASPRQMVASSPVHLEIHLSTRFFRCRRVLNRLDLKFKRCNEFETRTLADGIQVIVLPVQEYLVGDPPNQLLLTPSYWAEFQLLGFGFDPRPCASFDVRSPDATAVELDVNDDDFRPFKVCNNTRAVFTFSLTARESAPLLASLSLETNSESLPDIASPTNHSVWLGLNQPFTFPQAQDLIPYHRVFVSYDVGTMLSQQATLFNLQFDVLRLLVPVVILARKTPVFA